MQYAIISEKGNREENEDFTGGVMKDDGRCGCFVL